MQITLKQAHIEAAVKAYVARAGIQFPVDNIDFTAGRGSAGLTATIEMEDPFLIEDEPAPAPAKPKAQAKKEEPKPVSKQAGDVEPEPEAKEPDFAGEEENVPFADPEPAKEEIAEPVAEAKPEPVKEKKSLFS